MVGQYFRQFGLTAAFAVLASLLVARLLTPLMAAYFLRPVSPQKGLKQAPLPNGALDDGLYVFIGVGTETPWNNLSDGWLAFTLTVLLLSRLPSGFYR